MCSWSLLWIRPWHSTSITVCLWHQRPPIRHCLRNPSPAAMRKMLRMIRTYLKFWKWTRIRWRVQALKKFDGDSTRLPSGIRLKRINSQDPSLVSGNGLGHTFQGCSNGCDVHPKEQPSRNRQEAQSPKHCGSGFGRLASWRWVSENFAEKNKRNQRTRMQIT